MVLYACRICPLLYVAEGDAGRHRQDDHTYCSHGCNRYIGRTDEQIMAHYAATHTLCDLCLMYYDDEGDLHQHRIQEHYNVYCDMCKRMFIGYAQVNAHLASKKHQVKRIRCAAANLGCKATFVSLSAMIAHLEANVCVSGVTRRDVNTRIIALDPGRILVNPNRLLTNGTVEERSWVVTDEMYDANARLWVCWLCSKRMRHKEQLEQHLKGPAHAEKLFRCPGTACGKACGKEASSLSGIMQHIESQRCNAYELAMGIMQQLERKMSSFMITG
ncbi:hypothetical protein EXIGLDRAFT_842403 [Exidia glandulosa HHB12029]|uniref:C2H2-type domain-containing protein n=1 Tax=Exidia glandulosa HHB12029 TaxID=1314781 RepID=A0A165DC60_EXIGL|nr:hypothetical protein EXIGLDRAFT_842403 [Exidia glandulosa HHB12029]